MQKQYFKLNFSRKIRVNSRVMKEFGKDSVEFCLYENRLL